MPCASNRSRARNERSNRFRFSDDSVVTNRRSGSDITNESARDTTAGNIGGLGIAASSTKGGAGTLALTGAGAWLRACAEGAGTLALAGAGAGLRACAQGAGTLALAGG